jgi:hypothetical protein
MIYNKLYEFGKHLHKKLHRKSTLNPQKQSFKKICLPIIIFAIILTQVVSLSSIGTGLNPTYVYSFKESLGQEVQNKLMNTSIGIVDTGKLYRFNTSGIMGHAVIYSMGFENSMGGSFSINLVGILQTTVNLYYKLEDTLTLNGRSANNYTYTLTDSIMNISTNTSALSILAGSGTTQYTPKSSIYTYTLRGNISITTPFEFTPSIIISHTASTTSVSFYGTVQTLSPKTLIYQGKQDTVIIAGSNQSTASIRVGGTNPIGINLIELVLSSPTNQSVNLYNVDGYIQLFYQKSHSLQPVPEAISSGAYTLGGVNGVSVYPIYNQADPMALLSSNISSFQVLWPLNQTTITLKTEGYLTLQVNDTSVNIAKGEYQIPQYSGGVYIKDIIRLTPINMTGEVVKLNAPQYIQPLSDSRGLFQGWNNTYGTRTLILNLTKSVTISVNYKPQYLVRATYINQNNMSIIGSRTDWVNTSTTTEIRFPETIYSGRYVRYVFSFTELNAKPLNLTHVNLTVTSPINLYGFYTEQYLINFGGLYEKYYSRLDLWADASSLINITLPNYIQDGAYARLAFNSYTFENKTYHSAQIFIQLLSPVNITLNYTQEYQVNFTGTYSEYFYGLSKWYNQGQNYSVTIPQLTSVNSTFRLIYDFATINKTTINTTYLTGTVNSPIIIQLALTPQYFVDISGPNISVHGFFNKSQTITIQAPYYTGGIFRLDVFQEWQGTVNSTNTQLTLSVSRPVHEVAVYRATYIRLLLIATIVAAIIIGTIGVYIGSKRSKIFLS